MGGFLLWSGPQPATPAMLAQSTSRSRCAHPNTQTHKEGGSSCSFSTLYPLCPQCCGDHCLFLWLAGMFKEMQATENFWISYQTYDMLLSTRTSAKKRDDGTVWVGSAVQSVIWLLWGCESSTCNFLCL